MVPLLRQAGHDVVTPTLTGTGGRSHLLTRDVDLALHVQDIVQVLEYEDLREVVLVGHSYGGMVITGVAEDAAARIVCLIYLGFLPPDDGQCVCDVSPDGGAGGRQLAADEGNGWLVPPPSPAAFGISDPAEIAWIEARLRPMPLANFEHSVHAPTAAAARLPRMCIFCTESKGFDYVARRAQEAKLDYHELAAGHDAMVTAPVELTRVLFDFAATG